MGKSQKQRSRRSLACASKICVKSYTYAIMKTQAKGLRLLIEESFIKTHD